MNHIESPFFSRTIIEANTHMVGFPVIHSLSVFDFHLYIFFYENMVDFKFSMFVYQTSMFFFFFFFNFPIKKWLVITFSY